MTQQTADGVMERLKIETWPQHQAAEGHDFQRRMIRGELSREAYAAWLGQMLLVHGALERGLRAARTHVPAIAAVVHDEQFGEPNLRRDLAFFGVDAESVTATPGTADAVAAIERAAAERPLALLGYHYVLEGSKNGATFIARAVRRALGLTPGSGDTYLDPYGAAQKEKWAEFKAAMTAAGFGSAEIALLVEAAKEMFDFVRAVSDDLATVRA